MKTDPIKKTTKIMKTFTIHLGIMKKKTLIKKIETMKTDHINKKTKVLFICILKFKNHLKTVTSKMTSKSIKIAGDQ